MQGQVLVVGALSRDRIVATGGTAAIAESSQLGGVVTYASLTYSRLGAAVVAAYCRSPADAGLDERLAAGGVAVRSGVSPLTTAFTNVVGGDDRHQSVSAEAGPIPGGLVAASIRSARLIHLGPLLPSDLDGSLLTALTDRRRDCVVALDVQGLTRAVRGGVVERSLAADAPAWLAVADVIKGDTAELELVAGTAGIRSLAAGYGLREVVETRGSRGGRIHSADAASIVYRAVAVPCAPHPTGAGDVFFATYLWAREWRSNSIAAAAAAAATSAARQVSGDFIDPHSLRLAESPTSGSPGTRTSPGR